ncbi:MAG: fructose-bisphosphate aldolase [Spirochaetales bacterium]|nr:fructose-bisphosphate aldolase [Spirochaetales bacterium]
MNIGKQIRMNSIFRKDTGNSVIVAIDHGGIAGPMEGINDPAQLIHDCVHGGADSVLTTRGFARAAGSAWERSTSLILRLTGGFTVLGGKFEEEMISSADAALLYGASGTAATIKFGHEREGEFTKQTSLLADSCERWGIPLMIEAMAIGKDLGKADPRGIKLAARAAAEVGADIVKTYYTGDPDSFHEVVKGCPVPIVVLGGEKSDSVEIVFKDVHGAMQAGAKGLAIGRNIWQHENTRGMIEAMAGLVHENWTVAQAMTHV